MVRIKDEEGKKVRKDQLRTIMAALILARYIDQEAIARLTGLRKSQLQGLVYKMTKDLDKAMKKYM